MEPGNKSRKISEECYYLLKKFTKHLNKIDLQLEETIGNGLQFLEDFGEN